MLLLAGLWPGSLAALALGLAIGGFAGAPAGRAIPATLGAVTLGAATLALIALAVTGLVPGVPGFWVESAVAVLVPYLAGCGLAALARRVARVRPNDPPAA